MSGEKKGKLSENEAQQILQTFHQMRNEQKSLINKIAELEQDLTEHKAVLGKLTEVAGDRRCFRVIGGVLVERTVAEVLPAVSNNKEELEKLMVKLKDVLVKKGKEINDFKEKHDVKIKEQGSEGAVAPVKSNAVQSVLIDDNKA